MIAAHSFLSASRVLRANIFTLILTAAQLPNRSAEVFDNIRLLSIGSEMSHILMIDQMLYQDYPELLSLRCLNSDKPPMQKAWNYLASLPESDALFCKILRPRSETTCLNRNNFKNFVHAAHAAASYDNPTMAQYRTSAQDKTSVIRKIVQTYLEKRSTFALLGIGESSDAKMGETEKKEYMGSVLSDLEASYMTEPEGSAQRT